MTTYLVRKSFPSAAYYQPSPADSAIFNPKTPSEKMFFNRATPTHEELTETAAKARRELIAEGLLTAEELVALAPQPAADLAIERWKQQNRSWTELPPEECFFARSNPLDTSRREL